MRKFFPLAMLAASLLLFVTRAGAQAQSSIPSIELGLHFTAVKLDVIGEKPGGIGGTFTYNRFKHLAFDAEMNYFPQIGGNFGETQALLGVKLGTRFDRFGVFAKARPGFIHFGGAVPASRLSANTHFAFDVGGGFEYYPAPRWLIRVDYGDTIIVYGSTTFIAPFGTPAGPAILRPGTTHNGQGSVGFAIRF